MKKILHISKYYYPFKGGQEQTAKDFAETLYKKYDQKIICFNENKNNQIDSINGIEVIRCGIQAKIASQPISLSYSKMLRKIIKDYKPDIIIFHYPNPFVAHYLLKYLNSETKLILYWHLDIVKQKILKKLFYFQNKKLIQKSFKIIATSPVYIEGSYWLSKVKDKCIVIPSCINEERLQINDNVKKLVKKIRLKNKNKIICLTVGRHTEYKGTKYLIEASKYLDKNYAIYISGKGELTNELKLMAKDDPKINFLGLISDDELKAYLMACDIFCFPSISKNEAFGLALAEGMYFSKPAITFTIEGSGVNFVSLNEITGIEVENKNPVKYAEAIKELGKDVNKRKKYGRAAHDRVVKNFLLKQYKENVIKFIDSL